MSKSKSTGGNMSESPFEAIRHTTPDGGEYWRARELMEVLGYARWRNFLPAIEDAQRACEATGQTVLDHMAEVRQMIGLGKGAERAVQDYHLSRYACYLIVQNADPSKPIVALGQSYFAVQTRRQELQDSRLLAEMSEAQRRIFTRDQLAEHNKALAAYAQAAGVDSEAFARFQDHGYMGLYAGERARDIAKRKQLPRGVAILDWMNSHELAANLFRAAMTEDQLELQEVETAHQANQIHFKMGQAVRGFIQAQGGTMPECQPTPEHSIRELRRAELKRLEAERQPSLFGKLEVEE